MSEPKRQGEIALRAVTAATSYCVPLLAERALDTHHGSQGTAVRLGSPEAHAYPIVAVSAVVAKQNGRTVVGREQHIQVAVPVEIGVRRSARHDRTAEVRTDGVARVLELLLAKVSKEKRGFFVLHFR